MALNIYLATRDFPKDELFGLTSQLRRAAVSVPSNIAEGFNRLSLKEKIQFYSIALGSVAEVQSQIILAKELGYLGDNLYRSIGLMTSNCHKMLVSLIHSLRR